MSLEFSRTRSPSATTGPTKRLKYLPRRCLSDFLSHLRVWHELWSIVGADLPWPDPALAAPSRMTISPMSWQSRYHMHAISWDSRFLHYAYASDSSLCPLRRQLLDLILWSSSMKVVYRSPPKLSPRAMIESPLGCDRTISSPEGNHVAK